MPKGNAEPSYRLEDPRLKVAVVVTKDKQFLKFDPEGNAKIEEVLKASGKKDHLRVDVSGDVQGDTLKVTSIKLL